MLDGSKIGGDFFQLSIHPTSHLILTILTSPKTFSTNQETSWPS